MVFVYEGKQYCRKRGSRREVLDGIAYCTSGSLTAENLELRGDKIISKRRSEKAKERYAKQNPFQKVEVKESEPEPEAKPKTVARPTGGRIRRRRRAARRRGKAKLVPR